SATLYSVDALPSPHSFPTRRSSDLAQIAQLPADDSRRSFMEEELLFPLRQRILDLQQQLAVSQQGILALEVVIRNNRELIRGVRSEEHTSELQSRENLVCRLLLEKK